MLHIFVSATHILLENIIADPTHRRVRTDLKLIEPLLKLLGALANEGHHEDVNEMHQNCEQLYERTKKLVQTSSRVIAGSTTSSNGTGNERESVEDFLRRIESFTAGYDDEYAPFPQNLQIEGLDENLDIEFQFEPLLNGRSDGMLS